jgi:AcrR family transcriptional regulator
MDLSQHILNASRQILISEGYAAISMRRIAQAVGVTATSLYLHFENKHALFEALVDEGMDLLHERLSREAGTCAEPSVALDAICRAYLEFGLANPEYYEIMFVLRPRDMPRFRAEAYRRARRNLDLLADILGRVNPHKSKEDLRVEASATWASLHGAVSLINARRIDRNMEREAFLDAVVSHVAPGAGVRSDSSSPTPLSEGRSTETIA